MPFSISWRAASSGERVMEGVWSSVLGGLEALLRDEEREAGLDGGAGPAGLNPMVDGGCSRSFCSTLPSARSASWLMLFIISSMRDWMVGGG